MNFERGIDPRRTMGIGQIAKPLIIENIHYTIKRPIRSADGETMTWTWDMETEFSPSHCMRVLLGIQAGELNPEEHAVSYCEEDTGIMKTHMISDLLGTYVNYRGENYKIPTYDEIRERQEAIRSNRNRLPNLSTGCGSH